MSWRIGKTYEVRLFEPETWVAVGTPGNLVEVKDDNLDEVLCFAAPDTAVHLACMANNFDRMLAMLQQLVKTVDWYEARELLDVIESELDQC